MIIQPPVIRYSNSEPINTAVNGKAKSLYASITRDFDKGGLTSYYYTYDYYNYKITIRLYKDLIAKIITGYIVIKYISIMIEPEEEIGCEPATGVYDGALTTTFSRTMTTLETVIEDRVGWDQVHVGMSGASFNTNPIYTLSCEWWYGERCIIIANRNYMEYGPYKIRLGQVGTNLGSDILVANVLNDRIYACILNGYDIQVYSVRLTQANLIIGENADIIGTFKIDPGYIINQAIPTFEYDSIDEFGDPITVSVTIGSDYYSNLIPLIPSFNSTCTELKIGLRQDRLGIPQSYARVILDNGEITGVVSIDNSAVVKTDTRVDLITPSDNVSSLNIGNWGYEWESQVINAGKDPSIIHYADPDIVRCPNEYQVYDSSGPPSFSKTGTLEEELAILSPTWTAGVYTLERWEPGGINAYHRYGSISGTVSLIERSQVVWLYPKTYGPINRLFPVGEVIYTNDWLYGWTLEQSSDAVSEISKSTGNTSYNSTFTGSQGVQCISSSTDPLYTSPSPSMPAARSVKLNDNLDYIHSLATGEPSDGNYTVVYDEVHTNTIYSIGSTDSSHPNGGDDYSIGIMTGASAGLSGVGNGTYTEGSISVSNNQTDMTFTLLRAHLPSKTMITKSSSWYSDDTTVGSDVVNLYFYIQGVLVRTLDISDYPWIWNIEITPLDFLGNIMITIRVANDEYLFVDLPETVYVTYQVTPNSLATVNHPFVEAVNTYALKPLT